MVTPNQDSTNQTQEQDQGQDGPKQKQVHPDIPIPRHGDFVRKVGQDGQDRQHQRPSIAAGFQSPRDDRDQTQPQDEEKAGIQNLVESGVMDIDDHFGSFTRACATSCIGTPGRLLNFTAVALSRSPYLALLHGPALAI